MGTIVVISKEEDVVIASDSANLRDLTIKESINSNSSCLLKYKESYIGLNSTIGFQQAFEEVLPLIAKENSDLTLTSQSEIREFFSRAHFLLKHHHGLIVHYQQAQEFEWTPMNALIANRSGIYKVDSTRAVYKFKKFWAMGSGELIALGALSALYDQELDAEEIARKSLQSVELIEKQQTGKIETTVLSDSNKLSVVRPINSASKVKMVKKNPKGNPSKK